MPRPDPLRLPYPIARPYMESLRTDTHVSAVLDNTFATYSALLRFVGLTFVGQFLVSHHNPDDPDVIRVAKSIAALRQPTLESWFTAIHSVKSLLVRKRVEREEFRKGGPFSRPLLEAIDTLKQAGKAGGGSSIHETIRNLRNDEIGHHEGRTEEDRAAALRQVQPLIERVLEIHAPALEELTLLRSEGNGKMVRLTGAGPSFPSEPVENPYLEELFTTSSLVLQRGDEYLQLFPLLIGWPEWDGMAVDPVLSFDGFRVSSTAPDGHQQRTEYVRYRGFRGPLDRVEEYEYFRQLLDQKKISPYFDKANFQAWSVADWAASETRLNLAFHRGTKYFPEYYRERPGVETRVRRWLADGRKPAMLIKADAGFGKTSLFCKLAEELLESAGAEEESDDALDCVALVVGSDLREQSLFSKLCRAWGVAEYSAARPQGFRDYRELLAHWRKWAVHKDRAVDKRRVVVLLDAANEAREPRAVLGEVSDFAKAAHLVNEEAGRTWVRLLVSIRTVDLSVLAMKEGLRSQLPLIPAMDLLEEQVLSNGETRPYLELPEFSLDEAGALYRERGKQQPAAEARWEELHPRTQALLRQPLLVEIFHRTFAQAGPLAGLTIGTEEEVWAAWFERVLPARMEAVALREFALRIARECLEEGSAVITSEMAMTLLAKWEQKASRDEQVLHQAADLNLLERMAALGVLRQNPDGGWDWRAQSLGEQVAFRALPGIVGEWQAWLELPGTGLLQGALALMAAEWWRRDRVEELAVCFDTEIGRSSLARGLGRVAPRGPEKSIEEDLELFEGRLRRLVDAPKETVYTIAEFLLRDLPNQLEHQLGMTPALRRIAVIGCEVAKERSERDPLNNSFLYQLAAAYITLGNHDRPVDVRQSRRHYENSLGIAEQLVQSEPQNTYYLRCLSISYVKLGELASSIDLTLAQQRYEKALEITHRLMELEPRGTDFLSDLALLQIELGDLVSRLDVSLARQRFEKAIEIFEQVAALDYRHTNSLNSLAMSYAKLGDLDTFSDANLARQRYERGLEILEKLVGWEPYNSLFLGNLAALYDRLAGLDRSADAHVALTRFEKAHQISQRLAEVEPDNTQFSHALAVSFMHLGQLTGNVDANAAQRLVKQSVAILERLVQLQPGNTAFLRDLAFSIFRLGCLEHTRDSRLARELYEKAVVIVEQLERREPGNIDYGQILQYCRSNSAALPKTKPWLQATALAGALRRLVARKAE